MPPREGVLHVDGAAFGNPGPSGLGIVLRVDDDPVVELSVDAGYGTNNEAEYRALVRGLEEALRAGVDRLLVRSDSQLVVQQMRGEWRVKEKRLEGLKAEADALVRRLGRVEFEHVRRRGNARADELAKAGAEAAAARGVRASQGELLE